MKAIECMLCAKDVLVTLPIGFGKLAIYPFCAIVLANDSSQVEPIVLVILPLITLMRGQVASLTSRGVTAAYLCSSCPDDDSAIVNS